MPNDRVRLQVKTNVDPEVWSDVGAGAVGVGLPIEIESSALPTGAATSSNQTDGSQKTQIVETVPTDSTKTNGTLELGYNAAGQLVRIRKVINSTTYTQLITGDAITDTVVATTKTFGVWS